MGNWHVHQSPSDSMHINLRSGDSCRGWVAVYRLTESIVACSRIELNCITQHARVDLHTALRLPSDVNDGLQPVSRQSEIASKCQLLRTEVFQDCVHRGTWKDTCNSCNRRFCPGSALWKAVFLCFFTINFAHKKDQYVSSFRHTNNIGSIHTPDIIAHVLIII